MKLQAIKQKIWRPRNDVEAPSKGVLCNWVRDGDDERAPLIDMHRYVELLTVLPDHIVENLEKARLSHDGTYPMLRAGLGYEEMLSAIIVDGSAIASTTTQSLLAPAVLLPRNYLAISGNLPGKALHWKSRGRHTTLTTAATLTFTFGAMTTNVVATTTGRWAFSGAITMDTTIQTNTMWYSEGSAIVRSVGSAGTIFGMGDATSSAQALTLANQTAQYMGSAGSATPAAATIDTTVDQYVSLSAAWSLATAYSIQAHIFYLEALN